MSDSSVATLVNRSIGEALLETANVDRHYIALTTDTPLWALGTDGPVLPYRTRMPAWSAKEDEYLRQNHGIISEHEIGRHLGRTRTAVRIRWKRDLRLPAASKTPGFVTASGAARLLAVDVKAVLAWIDAGFLPAQTLPFDAPRHVRRIRIFDLKRFALRPESWTLFDPLRIPDSDIGSLIRRAHMRWGDVWLTTGQVSAMHRLTSSGPINRRIRDGTLPALRRGNGGNWLVKRSDAEQLVIHPGKGGSHVHYWPPEADAFIVLARAVGLTYKSIVHLMHWCQFNKRPEQMLHIRYHALRESGDLPAIILKHEMVYIQFCARLAADWPSHRWRFPYLARVFDRLAADHPPPDAARHDVRGVLRSWATYHLGPDHPFVRRLSGPVYRRPAGFWSARYWELIDCLSSTRRTEP